jgi:hypothetical protein
LSAWTDGYLGAAVALEALTAREWLDRSPSASSVLGRLEEAFDLAERAPRADQRSQGYRLLVKSLADAPARLLDRFPQATLAWLEGKAVTRDVDLRGSPRARPPGATPRPTSDRHENAVRGAADAAGYPNTDQ